MPCRGSYNLAPPTLWPQDLAGSVPLEALAGSVPHGFMRGKLFDTLAEHRVAVPRAVWFVQVAYLNRTK